MKRSLLIFAALCAASWTSVQAAQPTVDPVFASDVVDRYANHIYYGSGATGMALVVIDGNQRVFRSFGETRPGNNQHPQLDSVIRIASLSKSLAQVLDEHDIQQFVICGCATDYCLDTTIKNGASRGYGIVIAEDAHTTADRPAAQAATLIAHYNEVWRTLTIPGNPLQVKPTETILHAWQQN